MAHKLPCFNNYCVVCMDSRGQIARTASTLPYDRTQISTYVPPPNGIPGEEWEEAQARQLDFEWVLLISSMIIWTALLFILLPDLDNTSALHRANLTMLVFSGLGTIYTAALRSYGRTDSGNHILMKLVVDMRSSRSIALIVHLPIFFSVASGTAALFFVVVSLHEETPVAAILIDILGAGFAASLTLCAIRHRAGRGVVRGQV